MPAGEAYPTGVELSGLNPGERPLLTITLRATNKEQVLRYLRRLFRADKPPKWQRDRIRRQRARRRR